ncbi:hypothetical protein EAH87_14680 [Sphingomonas koreensis]|nr:hypothetical protein EAH87_14680 [Sphingomonas koreensis]
MNVVAIQAVSSVAFVRAVLRAYTSRQPFVIVRSAEEADRLPGLHIERFVEIDAGGGWIDQAQMPIDDAATAQVSFTSGTTGVPKGILLSHAALADTVTRLNTVMQLDDSVREYVGVPVTYSFGLGRVRAVAAAGGKSFLPSNGFDPREFFRMLQAGEVNALSAVPTLLRLLLAQPTLVGGTGHKLRWLEIGSQPLARQEKDALRRIFPGARIVQHYGLTEASRTTFLDVSSADGEMLDSVGQARGRTEIAIAEDGRIKIRGPHVAQLWIDADGTHALTDAEGWLTTNDLGAIDSDHLYFRGRADDLINCGGVKIVPDALEDRLRAEFNVPGGITVARVADDQRGNGILVAVERSLALDLDDVREQARRAIGHYGLTPGNALHVVSIDRLPTTTTGKVQRRELARQVERSGALAAAVLPVGEPPEHTPLALAIARLLGMTDVPKDASFVSLGGDSLTYVQASILIDDRLGYLPDRWEGMPLATLEALEPRRRPGMISIDGSVLVRALAILLVVLDHAWRNAAGGAAIALMLVAGQNYARFQLPKIFQKRSISLLTTTFWRVMVPYLVFVTLTLAYHHRMFWPQYFLLSNFTTGVYNDAGNRLLVPYWFLEDYLLYTLVFTGLLSWAPLNRRAQAAPWRVALVLFGILFVLGIAALFLGDTPVFYSQSPFSVGWIFALGWLVFQADSASRRRFVRIVALIVFPLVMACGEYAVDLRAGLSSTYLLSMRDDIFLISEGLAIFALIDLRRITLPAWIGRALSMVASASLYIYMCHPFVLHFISQRGPLFTALPAVAVSAVAGIGLWRAVGFAEARVSRLSRGDQPVVAG